MLIYSKYKTQELQDLYKLSFGRKDLNKKHKSVIRKVKAELVRRGELPVIEPVERH